MTESPVGAAQAASHVFIIGAMKSGTTSLFDILSQHPEICAARRKELDYFVPEQPDYSKKRYLNNFDWHKDRHRITLEASVAYAKVPVIAGVPERINNAGLGSCKFIYMVREPLARIESQVRHGLYARWGKSLDEEFPGDAISFSMYASQLREYLKVFPRSSVHVMTLEDFARDPDASLCKLCRFLEINPDFEFRNTERRRNPGEFFDSTGRLNWLTQSRVGQFIAERVLSTQFKEAIKNLLSKKFQQSGSSSPLGRWKLNENEKARILDMLQEDIAGLESEFGVNLTAAWRSNRFAPISDAN